MSHVEVCKVWKDKGKVSHVMVSGVKDRCHILGLLVFKGEWDKLSHVQRFRMEGIAAISQTKCW